MLGIWPPSPRSQPSTQICLPHPRKCCTLGGSAVYNDGRCWWVPPLMQVMVLEQRSFKLLIPMIWRRWWWWWVHLEPLFQTGSLAHAREISTVIVVLSLSCCLCHFSISSLFRPVVIRDNARGAVTIRQRRDVVACIRDDGAELFYSRWIGLFGRWLISWPDNPFVMLINSGCFILAVASCTCVAVCNCFAKNAAQGRLFRGQIRNCFREPLHAWTVCDIITSVWRR